MPGMHRLSRRLPAGSGADSVGAMLAFLARPFHCACARLCRDSWDGGLRVDPSGDAGHLDHDPGHARDVLAARLSGWAESGTPVGTADAPSWQASQATRAEDAIRLARGGGVLPPARPRRSSRSRPRLRGRRWKSSTGAMVFGDRRMPDEHSAAPRARTRSAARRRSSAQRSTGWSGRRPATRWTCSDLGCKAFSPAERRMGLIRSPVDTDAQWTRILAYCTAPSRIGRMV